MVSILGEDAPEVVSRGSQFLNIDRWPIRKFTAQMCNWAQLNPQKEPSVKEISEWVKASNKPSASKRQILLASTPYRLPRRLAMALVGGAYHEAWHTLYSCRRPLTTQEMARMILPRWREVPDWSTFGMILLDLSNLIEDVRIERLGTQEFPGAWTKMHDLQDYILQQEEALSYLEQTDPSVLVTVGQLFREYGLGYSTTRVQDVLKTYQTTSPQAHALVLNGPLRPLLEKTIALRREDDLACLEIGMDLLITLFDLSRMGKPEPPEKPAGKETQEAQHQQTAQETLNQISKGERLLNLTYESLASKHVQQLRDEEDEELNEDEAPYRAYNPSLDKKKVVGPSLAQRPADRRLVRQTLREVRKETTFLRSRLRALILDRADRHAIRASRVGSRLSLPKLVPTKIELLSRQRPRSPFENTVEGIAPSTAAAIVIDESSSMREHLKVVRKMVLILLDCLESVQCPTFAFGFKDGIKSDPAPSAQELARGRYHRACGVEFDIFKTFEEPFYQTNWRFSNIKTVGSTPMADGIHFGVNLLKPRTEKHRVLFLLTDGQPTGYESSNPEAVVRGQVSRARRAGIHLVAVGLGEGSKPVTRLFPDYVWSQELDQMPSLVVEKLRELFKRRRHARNSPDYE